MDSIIGCGGVIRYYNGNYMLGFASPAAYGDNTIAITYDVLHDLSLCANLYFMNVIDVGSYFDYHFLNAKEERFCSFALFYIQRDIRDLLNTLNCSFYIILEEGNACAQSIASWGCGFNAMTELSVSNMPFLVKGLSRLDQIGLSYVKH
ncbi:hypothetical protein KFK09_000389 [Dendrobium nobile]|uniref:RNase H type-1 domain-containing protein n=1 Tax=Dendrobium nobile TaxID=94219 RepID=A0A8T3C8R0_DENNO|nr:hypothetical protein KFK09_000389 [Dendrobium nobile]